MQVRKKVTNLLELAERAPTYDLHKMYVKALIKYLEPIKNDISSAEGRLYEKMLQTMTRNWKRMPALQENVKSLFCDLPASLYESAKKEAPEDAKRAEVSLHVLEVCAKLEDYDMARAHIAQIKHKIPWPGTNDYTIWKASIWDNWARQALRLVWKTEGEELAW